MFFWPREVEILLLLLLLSRRPTLIVERGHLRENKQGMLSDRISREVSAEGSTFALR